MEKADSVKRTSKEAVEAPENRRTFLRQAIGATGGIALAQILPAPLAEAQAGSPPFANPDEIRYRANERKLRAVIEMNNEVTRNIPNVANNLRLRYFQGWDPANPSKKAPASLTNVSPGPTLRARLGDKVEISFFNRVDDSKFPYSFVTEGSKTNPGFGCDASNPLAQYPTNDQFPNCFHGSSTANLHFHGTHTNPDGLGDNVLVQVLPDTTKDLEKKWAKTFDDVFNAATIPPQWDSMPPYYRTEQEKLVKAHDEEARKQAEKNKLPPPTPLWDSNSKQIHAHPQEWPQYIMGAFPNTFEIPEYKPGGKYVMGQAPGTHWYHAHKHGSTALHMLNGLAGALIIEGGYDRSLREFYGPNFVEDILVFQQIDTQQNLERTNPNPARTGGGQQLVNGQKTPTITMKPGEIQLWRIVNATVGSVGGVAGPGTIGPDLFTAKDFEFRQIAQDGVQFKWENYRDQPFLTSKRPGGLRIFAGNRADVLVKAPLTPGTTAITSNKKNVLFVQVSNVPAVNMDFFDEKTKSKYPEFPKFLDDLPVPQNHASPHAVRFGWDAEPTRNQVGGGRITSPQNLYGTPPHFTIDGKQFEQTGPVVDQCVKLGDLQDWLLENHTTVPHPFHIHVNPFQVVEINIPAADPNSGITWTDYKPAGNYVWQDVITIPPGAINSKTGRLEPGRVTIRHQFVDFSGTYVLHCHILAHEDRGMMQLVRVVDPKVEPVYPAACQAAIPQHH